MYSGNTWSLHFVRRIRMRIAALLVLLGGVLSPLHADYCNAGAPEPPHINGIEIVAASDPAKFQYRIYHNGADVYASCDGCSGLSSYGLWTPTTQDFLVWAQCRTTSPRLRIDAYKCGQWTTQFADVPVVDTTPVVSIHDIWGQEDGQTHVDYSYRFPNSGNGNTIYHIYQYADGRPARIEWSGEGLYHIPNKEGIAQVRFKPTDAVTVISVFRACSGETTIKVAGGSGECQLPPGFQPLIGATIGSGCSKCSNNPVSFTSGNMEVDEIDPLPSNNFFAFRRHYESQSPIVGTFGAGWVTPFGSFVRLAVDDFQYRYLNVVTEGKQQYVFREVAGEFVQISPAAKQNRAHVFAQADGSWVFTDPQAKVQRSFAADGRLVSCREIATGREVQINWSNGLPVSITDSYDNWTLLFTADAATHRVTAIDVAGHPDIHWSYVYSGERLIRVDSPLGTWRSYEHVPTSSSANYPITVVRDPSGKIIETHSYSGDLRALNSTGPQDEIGSIAVDQPGRVTGEQKATVTYKTGRVETRYFRMIAGRWETVEIDGGCSCGTGNATFVYDDHGNALRAQNADGYIVSNVYDLLNRVIRADTYLTPAACNPVTAPDRCRLTTDALATTALTISSATVSTTYEYGEANWPDRATIARVGRLLQPAQQRVDSVTLDPASGEVLTRTITGWTGNPAHVETRTTTTVLNDGLLGAPFLPGGLSVPNEWGASPQPKGRRRSVDGPLPGGDDQTMFVYYPVNSAVPQVARGRLAAIRNTAGHVTLYADYDAFRHARRVTDANGIPQTTAVDTIGRVVSTALPPMAGCDQSLDPLCGSNISSSRTYSGAGPLQSDRRPGGGTTVYEYDDRARVSAMSRGAASNDLRERIEYAYDPATGKKNLERILARENSAWVEKKRTSYAYDGFARVSRVTNADNTVVVYTYDAGGRVATMRAENNTSPNTFYEYDAAGRLSKVTQALATPPGGSVAAVYGYDPQGNLTSVTDPNGNFTQYTYDDFGQMIRQVSPVSGITTCDYDAAGRLIASVDANNASTFRTYDILGRVLSAASTKSGATETVTWTYDDSTAGRFSIGRPSTMTDPSGSTTYSYERRGLLRNEERTIGSWSSSTAYAYDMDGNRTKLGMLEYSYDYAGRPLTLAHRDCPTCTAVPIITSASYLPFGPERTLVFSNGTTQSRSYDVRYRITANTLATSATTLADFVYTNDPAGNITAISDAVDPTFNRSFGYDDLNRLTTADTGLSLWGTRSYAYDGMGDMLTENVGDWNASFSYDGTSPRINEATEQATVFPVEYDAAGNEISSTDIYRPPPDGQIVTSSSSQVTREYSPWNLLTRVTLAIPRPCPFPCHPRFLARSCTMTTHTMAAV